MRTVGNEKCRVRIKHHLEKGNFPLLLSGVRGVGKYTMLSELLSSQKMDFCHSENENSGDQIVILDDFSDYSLPKQDYYLKRLEESDTKFVVISHTDGYLLETVSSRFRSVVTFHPLSRDELTRDGFKELNDLTGGSYGAALLMSNFNSFKSALGNGMFGLLNLDLKHITSDEYKPLYYNVMDSYFKRECRLGKILPDFYVAFTKSRSMNLNVSLAANITDV